MFSFAPQRLGKYRLIRRLAVGGMAEVYLASLEGLSGFAKRVVIKRLLPQRGREADGLAMFLDEARLLATLKHPNLIEVYDVDRDGEDHFIVLEFVDGRDARDALDVLEGSPLPLPHAIAVVSAVAAALHEAHRLVGADGGSLGLVHRDVSPSNVLLGFDGCVKLIDFGVAKWAAQRSETRQGTLKGKCAYMSPEQARGEPLDGRSDLFALGVVLYEMTTGTRPFEGENELAVLQAIAVGRAPLPSGRQGAFPGALEAIVMRALAPRREDRFATGDEFRQALAAFAAEAGLVSTSDQRAAFVRQLFPRPLADQEPAALDPPGRTVTDWRRVPGEARPAPEPGKRNHRRMAWIAAVGVLLVAAAALGARTLAGKPLVSAPGTSVTAGPRNLPPAVSGAGEKAIDLGETVVAPGVALAPPAVRPPRRRVKAAGRGPKKVHVWDPDSPFPP